MWCIKKKVIITSTILKWFITPNVKHNQQCLTLFNQFYDILINWQNTFTIKFKIESWPQIKGVKCLTWTHVYVLINSFMYANYMFCKSSLNKNILQMFI